MHSTLISSFCLYLGLLMISGTVFGLNLQLTKISSNGSSKGQIADIDFLAFTPENVRESQYAEWYANWTLSRLDDPRWNEIGEWKLFAEEYFQTKNLECGSFWMDCKDMPTRFEILALYPNDRELARRVYFTGESYLIIRNYLKAVQTILDEVHMSLYGLLPEIVKVFTNQPDPSAQAACAIIGGFVDTLINTGVTAITGMMTSTVTSFYDKMKASLIITMNEPAKAAELHTKILTSSWIPSSITNWLHNQDQFNAWGEITPANTDGESLPDRVKNIFDAPPKSNYPPHDKPELVPSLRKVKNVYDKAYTYIPWVERLHRMPANLRMGLRFYLQGLVRDNTLLHLESSSLGGDGVCSSFGGADVNNNLVNINQVQGQLAWVFPQVLNSLSDVYERIYNGSILEKNQSSWLATSMVSHNWAEEKSYLQRLRYGADMKQQVMREFTLNIASQVSAKDGSYMKCTHKPWAAQKCNAMARAKPTDQAALAYFCPRPETDPGLICQVGRWAFSADKSHETPWPALLKLEGFAQNLFGLTRLNILNAAYDHYELHGNDLQVDWNSWFLGSLSSLTSFTMPVCKHDGLAMHDNEVHGPGRHKHGKNSWAFPNVCGINETETEDFFYELDILEGSQPWNSRSKKERWAGGGTNEFYNDRLVRANRHTFGTNPFLRYRAMCYQHIRFAQHSDWKRYDAYNLINHARVHKGRDQDCDRILAATAEMTADEGNRWFCQKHQEYGMDYGHTVFAREAWKVEIHRVPKDWVENHEHDCGKWLSHHEKAPPPPAPPILGVPRPESGMIWLMAMEFKKQYDKDLATKAENEKLDIEAEEAFQYSLKRMNKKEARAAKKRHKLWQKEAQALRENVENLALSQYPKIDGDSRWLEILKFPPQDNYKWKGWKGFLKVFSHPLELVAHIGHGKDLRPVAVAPTDPKFPDRL